MRINDWSSDVCSSDLPAQLIDAHAIALGHRIDCMRKLSLADTNAQRFGLLALQFGIDHLLQHLMAQRQIKRQWYVRLSHLAAHLYHFFLEIGRASCRGRVCQSVYIMGVDGS